MLVRIGGIYLQTDRIELLDSPISTSPFQPIGAAPAPQHTLQSAEASMDLGGAMNTLAAILAKLDTIYQALVTSGLLTKPGQG